MTIRARGYRDERRRRVMLDESRGEERIATVEPPRGGKRRRYPADALAGSQPYLTDFLPERRRTIFLSLFLCLVSSATALTLHWFVPQWQNQLPPDTIRFLAGFQPGSLLNLTQGVQICLGAWLCLLICAVRRRRLDDYRGSYQAWGLSAFVLASLSLFAFLPLAPLVGWSLAQIPRLPTLENHVHFTTWFVGIVAGSLLTRWLIETRRCRLAQSCLVAAGVLALLSNLQIVPLLKLSSYQLGELVTGALYFTSLLLGLAGLFVYGRHVRLDAQGLIAHHKKKVVKKKRTLKRIESEAAADEEQSTGEESEAAELPTPKAAISRSTVQQEEADDEEEEPEEGSRLSKAERRKLRRDQRKAS